MEHRILLGGEEYLPFARSCVTKLKALGLSYASQAFEVGGISINVRIEPGHEYIRIEGGGTAYMESGQLEWAFPGLETPSRLDPATWHFADILLDEKFLGYASTEIGKKFGDQKNKPLLTEGMNSRAIGPPVKITPPSADAETVAAIAALNDENKLSYENSVIMRKVVGKLFPPSLFSGKMRLFMQAQYGAKQQKDIYPFEAEVFGESILLKYTQVNTGLQVQFGLYAASSPGIYRAPLPPEGDGSYWLINITKPADYTVTAYPLKLKSTTSAMLAHMHNTKTSVEEKARCEAYVLAHAVILVDKPKVIHTFAGIAGEPLAYGWKFNSDGSEASIVVHKGKGEGFSNDLSWLSYTMSITISVARDPDTKEYEFSVTDSTTAHGEWTDGWGYWNIFVPTIESGGPIKLLSLKTNVTGVRLDFDFANTPVYGYYRDDVWTPVKMSRGVGVPGAPPEFKNKTTGPVMYGTLNASVTDQAIQYGVIPSTASTAYEQQVKHNKKTMTLTFGESVYPGETSNVDHIYFTRAVDGGAAGVSPGGFIGGTIEMAWIGVTSMDPPGMGSNGEIVGTTTTFVSNTITTMHTYNSVERDIWTLVIPPGDCEAVYIATNKFTTDVINSVRTTNHGSMVTHFSGTYRIPGSSDLESFSFEPWTQANRLFSGAFRPDPPPAPTSATDSPTVEKDETLVFCFNNVIHGEQGTPSGSYYTLFNVDRDFPYYNGAMYSFTSAGKRYAMSEGPMTPLVNYLHRFVGWA